MNVIDERKGAKEYTIGEMEKGQFFIISGAVFRRTNRDLIEMNFGKPNIEAYCMQTGDALKYNSETTVEPIQVRLHIIG